MLPQLVRTRAEPKRNTDVDDSLSRADDLRDAVRRALVSLAFVIAAALISIPLRPWLQFIPSTLFFAAVMLASWYGGRLSGLLATAGAVVAMDYVLFEPLYTLAPTPAYVFSVIVFAASALVIGSLTAGRRKAQQQLQQLNSALEDRVRERTGELISANANLQREIGLRAVAEQELARKHDQLLQTNRDLDEFASMASHDLQEPLRTIILFSELLKRRYSHQLADEAVHLLASVADAAQRMSRLVDDLLSYARAEATPASAEPVVLVDVVDTVRENLCRAVNESKAMLTCGPLPVVEFNRTELTQVLQNLIANALKYRREETPCVSIRAELQGVEWVVSVEDNGEGFDPGEAEAIFGPFKRLHRVAAPGSGMGLTICKRIIERNGGRIWAESAPGRGSIFHFSIPQQPKSAGAAATHPGRS